MVVKRQLEAEQEIECLAMNVINFKQTIIKIFGTDNYVITPVVCIIIVASIVVYLHSVLYSESPIQKDL